FGETTDAVKIVVDISSVSDAQQCDDRLAVRVDDSIIAGPQSKRGAVLVFSLFLRSPCGVGSLHSVPIFFHICGICSRGSARTWLTNVGFRFSSNFFEPMRLYSLGRPIISTVSRTREAISG